MITKINTVKNRNSKFPKRTGQIRYFNRLGSLLIRANENFINKNINSEEYVEKLKLCITELNLFVLEVYIKSVLLKYPTLSKELNGGTFRIFDKQFFYDFETETIKQKV